MTKIDAERARRLAWLALGIYIAGLGISAVLRNQGDFHVYYRTGHRVLRGLAIYPATDKDRFLYAPIFAIAFAPFALLPRHAAQGVFFLINAWALVALITGSVVMLFGRERRLSAVILVAPVILSFRFIGNNIDHGQINLPVLALCVWAIVYAREERPRLAGAMLAVALLIKPYAILPAFYLLLRRRYAALAWTLAAGLVLLAAPIVVFGPHGLVEQTAAYARSTASMTGRYRTMLTNQSAVAAVARIMSIRGGDAAAQGAAPMWIGMALEVILTAAVCGWIWKTRSVRGGAAASDWMALAAMFCVMPGFIPISWKSYYAAMLVPYMALVAALWQDRTGDAPRAGAAWVLLAISVVLNFIPGRHLSRAALFYSAHFLSSMFALGAIVAVRWAGGAAQINTGRITGGDHTASETGG
jgi:Glycosyltransferase family 87